MIPFNNLKPIFQHHATELRTAVHRVMKSGVYLMGPELVSFEREFSQFVGAKHTVGVGSGTDALTLALRSLGLENQEVLVPANAYPTAFGVASAQVKMRLCDVDPETLNVSVKTITRALTKKTKAIVVVHLYGFPAPMIGIMKLAKKHKLLIIEDCAQAVGAMIRSRRVGTFGHVGCFSFYPTKNLGAMGDGGTVATNSRKLAEKIIRLRMYGESRRYYSEEFSTHSRLDEIQSAILRVKLRYLNEELQKRQEISDFYRRNLPPEILVPKKIPAEVKHADHLFVIRTKNREELGRFFARKGIETAVHYPVPVHLVPAFKSLGYRKGDFPAAETASKRVLSLPLYTGLNLEGQKRILRSASLLVSQRGESA